MFMTNHYPSYAEIEARSRERLEAAKPALINALASLGVAKVIVEYDGEGDSGQINSVSATGAGGQPVDLTRPAPNPIGDGSHATLAAVIELFAWDALDVYHAGFENNDGGFGALTIEVGEGRFTLEHNSRFVDINSSETEV
jgi:hypothetical protein